MAKLILLFCSLLALQNLQAQYQPVADPAAFKARFAKVAQQTQSIASDFTQVKNLSMLSEKITSRGKFYYKKHNQVRMEYTTPYSYIMVINGNKVSIKDGQKTNTLSASSNKMFQQVNQLMMDCVKGTVFDNSNFSVRLMENGSQYLAEMTPITREMKTLFKNVKVLLNKTSLLVSQVIMTEPGGDQTTLSYVNQKLNPSLADALFILR